MLAPARAKKCPSGISNGVGASSGVSGVSVGVGVGVGMSRQGTLTLIDGYTTESGDLKEVGTLTTFADIDLITVARKLTSSCWIIDANSIAETKTSLACSSCSYQLIN